MGLSLSWIIRWMKKNPASLDSPCARTALAVISCKTKHTVCSFVARRRYLFCYPFYHSSFRTLKHPQKIIQFFPFESVHYQPLANDSILFPLPGFLIYQLLVPVSLRHSYSDKYHPKILTGACSQHIAGNI